MTKKKKSAVRKSKYDEFHREIGELVFWFAASENIVYVLANRLIGSNVVANVVMRNFHLAKAIDIVRDLAKKSHATSPNLKKLDQALLQFKDCAQDRNDLLHAVALPDLNGVTKSKIIQFANMRTMQRFQKERGHVEQLRTRLRNCTLEFAQAGIDMGLFNSKQRRHPNAEQGVAADGRVGRSAPSRARR